MSDYESKLTWFLVLLVFFLAVVNYQGVELSQRTLDALDAEFWQRAHETAQFIESSLQQVNLGDEVLAASGGGYVTAPSTLQSLEVRFGLGSLSLLDEKGIPVLSSEVRGASSSPELPGVANVPDALSRLKAGEEVSSGTYADAGTSRRFRAIYRPIDVRVGSSQVRFILAVAFEAYHIVALQRLSHMLVAYQVIGFLTLLTLLVFFIRVFMRPYRVLMSTAKAAGLQPNASADETAFVVNTFRETIARLKDREEELRRLHRREKTRADEQARLASHIARSMASGVVVFNMEGKLDFMNRAAEEILRCDARALAGATPETVFEQAPELTRLSRDTLATGQSHPRCEMDLESTHDTMRALGASTFPIHDESGVLAGALVLLTDLTDIKALQERMRLRENLASLGEMSAGIAHEFRNSLAAILGFANLMEKSSRDAPSVLQDVLAIKAEAEGLNRIVSEFLRFAKPLTPVRQPVDLKALTVECVRELKSQDAFGKVVFDHQDLLPVTIWADDLLLRQALGNLLRNGAEAALGKGAPPRVVISGFRGQEDVQLTISDNGDGVPEGERERVFLPFFTTKDSGTGLGLAIAQKIVLAHDGEIRIEGKPGEGAAFVVILPCRERPESAPVAAAPAAAAAAAPSLTREDERP
ncbi:MAG: ATP-binding protein [Acidobacteriota bacterium]